MSTDSEISANVHLKLRGPIKSVGCWKGWRMMPNCKACGSWFAAVNKREALCPICERALARLAGYAVPVVRCKDCKHIRPEVDAYTGETVGYWCYLIDFSGVDVDGFCSYGERKENNDEKV